MNALALTALLPVLRQVAGPVLTAVLDKGRAPDVIRAAVETLRNRTGTAKANAEHLQKLADEDPQAFADVIRETEATEQARWAALLAESRSASLFVAGARPAAIWSTVLILVYGGVVQPVLAWLTGLVGVSPPPPVSADIWAALVWILPLLYAARSVEGIAGAKRDRL